MTGDERAILIAAQKKATKVLAASRAEAGRVVSQAETDAVALLLEQQKRAERLIQQAHENGIDSAEGGQALLESHRRAAEVLATTEEEVAAKLSETTANAAVDVLMAGQREAAAILLESWMQVTEGRPPAGERSR